MKAHIHVSTRDDNQAYDFTALVLIQGDGEYLTGQDSTGHILINPRNFKVLTEKSISAWHE